MERQKYRFHLWIVWCVFGFANSSNGDIQCPDDSPINCPNTVNCCKLDQFCHTGICDDCPWKNIPTEELLIKCRNMTLKDMNISSEIQLSCLHMCRVYFKTEEINKYLQEQIETVKRETANLSNRIKEITNNNNNTIKKLNGEIKDLKQRWSEISQILNQMIQNNTQVKAELNGEIKDLKQKWSEISQILNQTIQNNTQVKAELNGEIKDLKQRWSEISQILNQTSRMIGIYILVPIFIVIFIGAFIYFCWRQKRNKKVLRWEANYKGSKLGMLVNTNENLFKDTLETLEQSLAAGVKKQDEMKELIEDEMKELIDSENRKNEEIHRTLNDALKKNTDVQTLFGTENLKLTTSLDEVKKALTTAATKEQALWEAIEELKKKDLALEAMIIEKTGDQKMMKDDFHEESMKHNTKVKLQSNNLNKTETSTEGASIAGDLNSDGNTPGDEQSTEESAPNTQMSWDEGFDSFATTLEKPKALGVKAHNGFSLSSDSEDEKWVHTSLSDEES